MEDTRRAAVIKHLIGNGNNNHPQSIAFTNNNINKATRRAPQASRRAAIRCVALSCHSSCYDRVLRIDRPTARCV